jgi:bifunctional non-homologous end joining protein LigD
VQRLKGSEYTRQPLLVSLDERIASVPRDDACLLYCDHVQGEGERLFELACQEDLEGILAKRKDDPYIAEHVRWLKIRNTGYSQWVGREELF